MKETYTPPAHIKAEQWKHDERWRLANRMHQRDYRARQKAEKEMRENQLCWSCGEMRDQVLELQEQLQAARQENLFLRRIVKESETC